MDDRNLKSIRQKLRSIRLQATRHRRGNNTDPQLLIADLEMIEAYTEKALEEAEKWQT